METFRSLGYIPHLMARGTIGHLRGCLWCLDLDNVDDIDSVTISARSSLLVHNSKPLYRFEYALRGNIKNIPPDRRIAYTELTRKGFILRKLNSIKWGIPYETDEPSMSQINGASPKFGEIWEEGPHKVLVKLLNEDLILMEHIKELIQRIDELKLFMIYSDKWNESVRLTCSAWIDSEKSLELYLSSQYLDIAQRVLGHIRRVRRHFGGLTF